MKEPTCTLLQLERMIADVKRTHPEFDGETPIYCITPNDAGVPILHVLTTFSAQRFGLEGQGGNALMIHAKSIGPIVSSEHPGAAHKVVGPKGEIVHPDAN